MGAHMIAAFLVPHGLSGQPTPGGCDEDSSGQRTAGTVMSLWLRQRPYCAHGAA
jgi:hypothetical protein